MEHVSTLDPECGFPEPFLVVPAGACRLAAESSGQPSWGDPPEWPGIHPQASPSHVNLSSQPTSCAWLTHNLPDAHLPSV